MVTVKIYRRNLYLRQLNDVKCLCIETERCENLKNVIFNLSNVIHMSYVFSIYIYFHFICW